MSLDDFFGGPFEERAMDQHMNDWWKSIVKDTTVWRRPPTTEDTPTVLTVEMIEKMIDQLKEEARKPDQREPINPLVAQHVLVWRAINHPERTGPGTWRDYDEWLIARWKENHEALGS